VRDENIEQFVAAVKDEYSTDDLRFDAVLEGAADPILLADAEPGRNIVELHAVWQGEEIAWRKFNEFHNEVRAKARESKRLKKHDLGVLTEERNQYSLRMRRQELDHDIFLIPAAKAIESVTNEQAPLAAEREMTSNTVSGIVAAHSADSPLGIVGSAIGRWWIGQIDTQMATANAALDELEGELARQPEGARQSVNDYLRATAELDAKSAEIQSRIDEIKEHNESYELRMVTAQGQDRTIALADVIRAYPANQLTTWEKLGVYFSRWGEFLTEEPIESGSAGGVFPAIWGTVVMTIIMSLAVVPFGVLAALYLREYAKAGFIVSAVRISINNLAGVPSIVFGVFGLGFFCYLIGAYVDGGPGNAGIPRMPPARWYAVAFALAVIAVTAFLCGAFSFSARAKEASKFKRLLKYLSFMLWIISTVLLVMLIFGTPFFSGFYETSLPNPTFGKGGLLWASLTLALLTLPVVIVATEEALSAVPNSLREGSYACGGSKWQTIKRIVLPHAMPGIMTGMILAMARGAGEVAPLMLVGVVKEATDLPLDSIFPYFHGNRSFLHLGFYIYERGFQSQDSEAAKPIVFSTTLLLISIVFLLNLFAVFLRSRLRKHFQGSQF
jgi:phosphate transport system permease protein